MYTLADLPRRGARLHGPRTAVVFEDTRLTYEKLNRRVNQAAHTLAGLGLGSGERLTILSDNSACYLETYLAAAKLGVSVTPLNTRLSEAELDYIVTDSEAVAIVVGDSFEEKAASLLATVPGLRFGVSLDNDLEGFTGYEAALAHASAAEPHPARAPSEDDLAVLMYTGGTTGAPKGVMLSHRNVMTATIADAITLGFTKEDSTCFVLPIFHVSWWPILSAAARRRDGRDQPQARPQRDPSAHPGREVHPHERSADPLRVAHGHGTGRFLRPAQPTIPHLRR